MDSKKLFNIILIFTMAEYVLTDEYDPSLKYIVEYMKNSLSTYQVTVTFTSAKELSTFGSKIVKVMIDEFSSIVINKSVIEKIPAVRPFGSLWGRTIDQSGLKVNIIQVTVAMDILQELKSALFFLMSYSENVRGKCIIVLINGNGQSLEPFLRLAWSNDFLDLTVVEWINTTQTRTLPATENLASEVLVHIFDPFQDKYSKNRLSNTTDILPNKARNLNGYHFYADLRGAPELDGRTNFQESEVEPQMKYLVDTLNISMTHGILNDAEDGVIPVDDLYVQNASRGHPIDFFLHTRVLRLPGDFSNASDYMDEISYSMLLLVDTSTPFEYRFLVLQEKTLEIRISSNFLTTFVTLSGMGLIFLLSSRAMMFDRKIWSTVKIARALMGGSFETRRRIRLAEKVLLTTLYFVSIITITLTSDELLKMSMSKREVLRLTTLEELTNSKMGFHTEKQTIELLSLLGKDDPKLQKIANQSTVIVSMDEILNVTFSRAPLNSIYLSLKESRSGFPHVIKTAPNSYLTFLKGVAVTEIRFAVVRRNFPLKERFAEFFLKLSESGLLMHHEMLEISQWYSHINARNTWGEMREMYKHYRPENDKDEKLSLNQRLLIIILSGYALASIALIWEIFFKSQCPVKIAESNSKRERFVRCLVEEAKAKIIGESIREFELIQHIDESSHLKTLTDGECNPEKSTSSVECDYRKKNENLEMMAIDDRQKLYRSPKLHSVLLDAYVEHKNRSRIRTHTHDGQPSDKSSVSIL
ncbi:hypothetical protein QAD02_010923 [Eretmocerus hayati]|uniref:Uncharacterized protein n=1 Tax=Eretmocerus hayati TaxID=131215 RepID=A0ACC2NVM1_9HYME|nr:hypothetical protein QAD02_010923 [Eretmocerus hayati]